MGDRIDAGMLNWTAKCLPSLTEQYCLSGLSLLSATLVSTVSIWQKDKNFFPQVKPKCWNGLAAHEQDTQSLIVKTEEVHTTRLTTSLLIVRNLWTMFSHPWPYVTDVSWLQIWRVFTVFVITFTTESRYRANITIKLMLTWSHW